MCHTHNPKELLKVDSAVAILVCCTHHLVHLPWAGWLPGQPVQEQLQLVGLDEARTIRVHFLKQRTEKRPAVVCWL